MAADTLSAKQAHALLDILSHNEVYGEILDFRFPDAIDNYGPPFQDSTGEASQSPSLQTLVAKFLLQLPGLRDVDDAFWKERVATLVKALEDADLSESYDKGNVGIRKTLATAVSALIEYPVRGVFGGFDEPTQEDLQRQYDASKAEDLQRSFRDAMHQMVYGSLVDDMFKKSAETDKLADHPDLVQATHEYILVNLASFMHYTLIISPKGQSLLTLIDHANKLVPYTVIKQTLKIGNVASMLNAMMKVVLAKMSMGSVTNWIGWTSGADEGMNLMQHIIYQVLQWDVRDLKSRGTKIEKDKTAPRKDQLEALKSYISKDREEQTTLRHQSRTTSTPIVDVILGSAGASSDLSKEQHKIAQDYLAVQLAIRDRDQIVKVFCQSTPDHLTQSVRDVVAAYDPLIRQTHRAVDLSATMGDFEIFLRDMIKLAKVSEQRGRSLHKAPEPPTVGDFVQLLKKHQGASHRFIHQVCKNGPELSSWFRDYLMQIASNFRRKSTSGSNPPSSGTGADKESNAGDLTTALNELFTTLPEQTRANHLKTLDKHAAYMQTLHKASLNRLRSVLASPPSKHSIFTNIKNGKVSSTNSSRSSSPAPISSTAGLDADPGPGAFLARWQALIDASEVTPVYEGEGVRSGGSGSVLKASRVGADAGLVGGDENGEGEQEKKEGAPTVEEQDSGDEDVFEEAHERLDQFGLENKEKMRPPDVTELVEKLLPGFREVLQKSRRDW